MDLAVLAVLVVQVAQVAHPAVCKIEDHLLKADNLTRCFNQRTDLLLKVVCHQVAHHLVNVLLAECLLVECLQVVHHRATAYLVLLPVAPLPVTPRALKRALCSETIPYRTSELIEC